MKKSISTSNLSQKSIDFAASIGKKILFLLAISYELGYLCEAKDLPKEEKKLMVAKHLAENILYRRLRQDESVLLENNGDDFSIRLESKDKEAIKDIDWFFSREDPTPSGTAGKETSTTDDRDEDDLSPFFDTHYEISTKYREMGIKRGKEDAQKQDEIVKGYEKMEKEMPAGLIVDPEECVISGFSQYVTELFLKRDLFPCEFISVDGCPSDVTDIWDRIELCHPIWDADGNIVDCKSHPINMDAFAIRLSNEFLSDLISKCEGKKK